ncbi:uncharacterized protein BDR25DRAFT_304310 [Lindgomyces ingoldianus]|uniref:Uncharacterized protein n=1 Tax=Lindgomyces ingoldianus TaxID=673940 RepID=A0ACB6QRN9_9PLEO|nr:uncharacterized protein BDR25DRAFT_304310 [Lindgomyces ingoldianus]KAF2469532.1 hypothetical protein BDR25DRAFT_304310 [Lindgomyces ingoldianus]
MDSSQLSRRTAALQELLESHGTEATKLFITHLDSAKGDLDNALASWDADPANSLSADQKRDLLGEIRITSHLAAISDDDVDFVRAAKERHPNIKTLREFAINSSLDDLASMAPSPAPAPAPALATVRRSVAPSAATASKGSLNKAVDIRRKLFLAEPTGVVMRMVKDSEIRLDSNAQDHVFNVLNEDPEFDMQKSSVTKLLSRSNILTTLPAEDGTQSAVQSNLKTLQRVQALAPIPEAINPLIKSNLTSALHISNMSEVAFVEQMSSEMGDTNAAISIHQHATQCRIRNENFLLSALQAVRGSGLRVIDGGNSEQNVELRKQSFTEVADKYVTQVDLERLFGNLDFCECPECGSVYGPAAYFVELMEFLRNNNLSSRHSKTGDRDINGTQLQALLKRRPDLACLQLTCENTNTYIPYIDLALEVMESYVVHAPMIKAYNVNGETTNELLCSPQHTQGAAYEILRKAGYPLGLPYHFPIDTMRVFLQFLKTNRADIIQVFQGSGVLDPSVAPANPASSVVLRSFDAEFNLLTQEEYVILTKEGFWAPTTTAAQCHQSSYTTRIGLKKPWGYFGYDSRGEMLDDNSATKTGISWVKAQFLKRAGIQYGDLVELVKTRYVNPNMPKGKDLTTMERIRFSYRFLRYLVQHQYTDKRRRYAKLINFLQVADVFVPLWEKIQKLRQIDLCADQNDQSNSDCSCGGTKSSGCHCCPCNGGEWAEWVYSWFEKIGSIVVLESGNGPRIPLEGQMWAESHLCYLSVKAVGDRVVNGTSSKKPDTLSNDPIFIGTLQSDGAVIDRRSRNAVAFVSASGTVINLCGKNIQDCYRNRDIYVYKSDADVNHPELAIGEIRGEGNTLSWRPGQCSRWQDVEWSNVRDACDISTTRLLHLDGSQLSPDEYFNMVRFLRLWRKLGWTIPEVDSAIQGLGKTPSVAEDSSAGECDASVDPYEDDSTDTDTEESKSDINPPLVHQIVAVRNIIDMTGLSLEVVLTFWDVIPTHGDTSLYNSTFLTHDIVRMDPVFQADEHGNYLTATQKISDHMPVLQTTLKLKAADIELIRQLRNIPDSLTIDTLSELFRISTLISYLSVRPDTLPDIIQVLGEPFTNADTTLSFLQTWQDIINSNFSFEQLNYLIRGVDNISRPLAPTPQVILKLGKSLLDGLEAIMKQNADITSAEVNNNTVSLTELLPSKLALIFAPALATKISDLINGRMVFTTNAPSGLAIMIPPAMDTLVAKVKYNDLKTAKPPTAQLTVTGILTDDETTDLKGLSANALWIAAVDRIKKQGVTFFNQYLRSIIPPRGQGTLLAGDTAETPITKALFFLRYFLPYLRARLSTLMVQQTMFDALGTDITTISYLLNIVKSTSGDSAMNVLLTLRENAQGDESGVWSGYLIPSTTDKFQFWVTSDAKPAGFTLDGIPYGFPNQSEDPTNIWSSAPISLVDGRLYALQLSGTAPETLSWSTSTSPPTLIPSGALLPAVASSSVSEVLVELTKISVLAQGFGLSLDEIIYLHEHGTDFSSGADQGALNLGNITMGAWKRLLSYTNLRNSLPKQQTRLIDLFAWSRLPGSSDVVSEIVKVTRWDAELCSTILKGYDSLTPEHFHNELLLVSVKKALDILTKTQIAAPLLFEWAKPLNLSDSSYTKFATQADTLKKALRSRYNASEWEQAAKPLFDTLRRNQRDALVSYLIVEPSLVETGLVKDPDGLFEYFLIDCQMSSCLQTSRIKQAISTIQLYVQRCLLGLEAEVAQQPEDLIDRKRWNWMKRYRVWEANRQVYLYPENWIVPSLRDDKSPFFLDLESALQQKDISLSNAVASLKTYVHNVAAVANLKVFGLFIRKGGRGESALGAHVVACRQNAPYDWYTRDYSPDGRWSPWVRMQVDIPHYDVDDGFGNPVGTGSYVAPYLWQGRPILFFMQMTLKHITIDNASPISDRMSKDVKGQNQSVPMWQINLGVTRFDNGKWKPKELSQKCILHSVEPFDIQDLDETVTIWATPNQARYQMIPRFFAGSDGSPDYIQIDIAFNATQNIVYNHHVKQDDGSVKIESKEDAKEIHDVVGSFLFIDGGIAQTLMSGNPPLDFHQKTSFQYIETSDTLYSYQIDDGVLTAPQYYRTGPSFQCPQNITSNSRSTFTASYSPEKKVTFNHTFVDQFLKQINTSDDIGVIYEDFLSLSRTAEIAGDNPYGTFTEEDGSTSYHELLSPYGIYNWEIGLHGPMTLIDALLNAQQFDDALKVCHIIFDPSIEGAANSSTGNNKYFWKFLPFKALANTDAKESLEQMFLDLQPGRANQAISEWRDNSFAPHVVARMRPVAYMKWIAMKYIEILITYGDYYFRQNSLETIPEAIQCYILASHVYGNKPQKIPRRGKVRAETYSSLLNRWDAFGNAVVQMEVEFPFSNQTSQVLGSSDRITGFANIFGFASSLYFGIPNNPKLAQLRDTIDDRLFKIRNCMDINGVVRKLPLFDPPIDPALLVAATAQGLSIDTVLNDLSGSIPNYRFMTLLAKALEICSELKSLGAALLAAKEKKDNEHLSLLRSTHEMVMNTFQLDLKNRALEEANAVLEQLLQNREAPKSRLQYYKGLVGVTDPAPGETDDFTELPNPSLQAPIANGQMMLIAEENEELEKSSAARDWNIAIGAVETLAGLLHMLPEFDADIKPFGCGTGLKWGGNFLGSSTGAIARGMQIYTQTLSADASNASRKASYLRALQDRIVQANSNGHELKNVDKQIATQRLRVATTTQEIKNAQTVVDQANEVNEFLRSKYTNEELYIWMESRTRSLYNDTYNLAYDLAKRAEKCFQFERPQMATSSYIEFGYFTSARDGLLAGESLYLGLKRLEAACQENLGHDFEVTKHISVRQWAPMALIEFREKGTFMLELPEILFDMDCPGHYMRRIVSVNVSIPCVAGPYAGINCTLRLLNHSMRTTPRANSKSDYHRAQEGEDDDRFITTNLPISAVVLSGAQADSGRFDQLPERYNPFEGAGAISTWSFTLPSAIHSFDYSSITDVVLTLRYTALDGGDKLRKVASDVVADYMKVMLGAGAPEGKGLFTYFDLRTDFASEWYRAGLGSGAGPASSSDDENTDTAVMNLDNLSSRLPLYTTKHRPEKIIATRIAILAKGDNFNSSDVEIVQKGAKAGSQTEKSVAFKPGRDIEPLIGVVSAEDGLQLPMTSWQLKVKRASADVEGAWMVVRYSLV